MLFDQLSAYNMRKLIWEPVVKKIKYAKYVVTSKNTKYKNFTSK